MASFYQFVLCSFCFYILNRCEILPGEGDLYSFCFFILFTAARFSLGKEMFYIHSGFVFFTTTRFSLVKERCFIFILVLYFSPLWDSSLWKKMYAHSAFIFLLCKILPGEGDILHHCEILHWGRKFVMFTLFLHSLLLQDSPMGKEMFCVHFAFIFFMAAWFFPGEGDWIAGGSPMGKEIGAFMKKCVPVNDPKHKILLLYFLHFCVAFPILWYYFFFFILFSSSLSISEE